MKLTDQQQNCPYCHGGDDHQRIYDSDRSSQNLTINLKHENDKHHPRTLVISHRNTTGEVDSDWDGSYYEVRMKYWVPINYCPMCGRPLTKEKTNGGRFDVKNQTTILRS